MFREDFEFHDAAGASHHGGKAHLRVVAPGVPEPKPVIAEVAAQTGDVIWLSDAERELKKIPFFVRGKAKRNTEKYAADKGLAAISIDTLYEAKAHYAR
jgi:light-independent protochlorophyllide reductase subunit B